MRQRGFGEGTPVNRMRVGDGRDLRTKKADLG
jgi:hypothetical protein